MRYFGKCTTRDATRYPGSGLYWKKHIKKHGIEHVATIELFHFDLQEDASEFALNFSRDNDIVNSPHWANLIVENGLDGMTPGTKFTIEHRKNITKALLERSDEVKERIRRSNIGKTHTQETKDILRMRALGKKHTPESKDKMSASLKEAHKRNPRTLSEETREKISKAGVGRKHSNEAKERIGKAHKNKNVSVDTRLLLSNKAKARQSTCKVCGETHHTVTISRWHNEKCQALSK